MNRIFKYALMFAFVGIAMFALNQMSDGAEAADVVWDGGGADNKASTGNNWVGNVAPVAGDSPHFDGTSVKDCTWDLAIDHCTNFHLHAGYTGTVNLTVYTLLYGYSEVYSGHLKFSNNFDGWLRLYGGNATSNYDDDILGQFVFSSGNFYQYKNFANAGFTHTGGNFYWYAGNNVGTSYYNLNILGPIDANGLSVSNNLVLNGKWTDNIFYNGTADISTDQQHWTGWLYTSNDIAIEYNSYAYLEFNHDALLGIQLESWSGTDNFTWNATSVASQTVIWSWSRGESTAMYDEYMDTIYIGSDETNAGGMGTFTSTFVGSHAFLLSRSTFLPASTDIDDSVWLGILFMCIATIINFVGYIRKIGLLQIVSFLVLLVGIFAATDVWEELWTLPTLFVLTNAVIFTIGMMRKG